MSAISGMWRAVQGGSAKGQYSLVTSAPFYQPPRASRSLLSRAAARSEDRKWGLNRWGNGLPGRASPMRARSGLAPRPAHRSRWRSRARTALTPTPAHGSSQRRRLGTADVHPHPRPDRPGRPHGRSPAPTRHGDAGLRLPSARSLGAITRPTGSQGSSVEGLKAGGSPFCATAARWSTLPSTAGKR